MELRDANAPALILRPEVGCPEGLAPVHPRLPTAEGRGGGGDKGGAGLNASSTLESPGSFLTNGQAPHGVILM